MKRAILIPGVMFFLACLSSGVVAGPTEPPPKPVVEEIDNCSPTPTPGCTVIQYIKYPDCVVILHVYVYQCSEYETENGTEVDCGYAELDVLVASASRNGFDAAANAINLNCYELPSDADPAGGNSLCAALFSQDSDSPILFDRALNCATFECLADVATDAQASADSGRDNPNVA